MINVLLIAGDKTEKLTKFLEQRGAFEITNSYRSIAEDISTIRDSIINVDKMIYLLDSDTVNIRTEMQLLKELLLDEGFFTVREIVFIATESVDADKAIRYFKVVMQDSNFSNYSVHKAKNKLSFADIFDLIIGISRAENYKNTYKSVYRVERNSESDVAYMAEDNSGMTVEPFNYERVQAYEAAKKNSLRAESGILHKDETSGVNIVTAADVDLGDLQLIDSVNNTEIFLVSGDRKTGVSTWSAALAASAKSAGKTVTLIDFTDNCDIEEIIKSGNVNYTYVRMLDLLRKHDSDSNSITLVSTFNNAEREVRTEFLQHLFANKSSLTSVCIIAAPVHLFDELRTILVDDISKILYCINPIFRDIVAMQPTIAQYSNLSNFYLVLNNRVQLIDEAMYLNKEGIEGLLPFDLRIIQAIDFQSINVDANFYESLMEV